jgi:hypothetical protein
MGCSRTFSLQNSLMESTVCCHDKGLTCWGTVLAHRIYWLSQMFQCLGIKLLIDSLNRWDKFLVHYPFVVKKKKTNIVLTFDFQNWAFWGFPLNSLPLHLMVTLENPVSISTDSSICPFIILLDLYKSSLIKIFITHFHDEL